MTRKIIRLINPGSLVMPIMHRERFERMNAAAPGEHLSAFAEFDNRFRWWAIYPQVQLDLLSEIALTLIDHFGLKAVLAYDQLRPLSLNPGPSFPRYLFFEALKAARRLLDVELRVLEKTAEVIQIRLQKVSGDMALVVARIGAELLVRDAEGWVRCVDIEAV